MSIHQVCQYTLTQKKKFTKIFTKNLQISLKLNSKMSQDKHALQQAQQTQQAQQAQQQAQQAQQQAQQSQYLQVLLVGHGHKHTKISNEITIGKKVFRITTCDSDYLCEPDMCLDFLDIDNIYPPNSFHVVITMHVPQKLLPKQKFRENLHYLLKENGILMHCFGESLDKNTLVYLGNDFICKYFQNLNKQIIQPSKLVKFPQGHILCNIMHQHWSQRMEQKNFCVRELDEARCYVIFKKMPR